MASVLSFKFDDKAEFAEWVALQTRSSSVNLALCHGDGKEYREELLKSAGRWPSGQIQKIDETHQQSVNGALQHSEQDLKARTSSQRSQLGAIAYALFAVDAQSKPGRRQTAVFTLKTYLDGLREDEKLWKKIESPTKFALSLPLRKKREMKQLLNLLGPDARVVWSDAVERVFRIMHTELLASRHADSAIVPLQDCREKARDRLSAKTFRALRLQWLCRKSSRQVTVTPTQQGTEVHCKVEVHMKAARVEAPPHRRRTFDWASFGRGIPDSGTSDGMLDSEDEGLW